jgi:hypothetical protein
MTLESAKVALFGGVTGIALALGFALPDFHRAVSHTAVFDRIEIGMSSAKALDVLRQARIECGVTNDSSSNECHFSDFTGEYLVQFDPNAHRVMQKSYRLRAHTGMFSRKR